MEKLLDKSISQTDEVVKIACQAIAGMDRLREKVIELEAERDRLREINKELVEACKNVLMFTNSCVAHGKDIRLGKDLCSLSYYAKYHSDVLESIIPRNQKTT